MLSDLEKNTEIIDGNVCLFEGSFEKAFEHYLNAGVPKNFIRLARASLNKGDTDMAIRSFELAGIEPSRREREVIEGDQFFAEGNLVGAYYQYRDAGARNRLLKLASHSLKKRYVLLALECYGEARVKPPEDELRHFVDSYARDIDQRIKERNHIGVKEACFALGDKDKLKSIANSLIEKKQILLGIYFYEDTGEKFPASRLTRVQRSELVAEGDRSYRESLRGDCRSYSGCIKAYTVAGARDRLLELFDKCLEDGELRHSIEIIKALYGASLRIRVPREMADRIFLEMTDKIFSYAKVQFRRGKFKEGMKACNAIGRRPPKKELYNCGEKCFFVSDERELLMLSPEVFREGLKAYRKAGLAPSRKKLIAAGNYFLKLGNYYYARQAFEEALSIEHLQNLVKFFEKKNEELVKEKEDPEEIKKWASNINSKGFEEEVKKSLIKMREDSLSSSIRFNESQISEIQEAQKRVINATNSK